MLNISIVLLTQGILQIQILRSHGYSYIKRLNQNGSPNFACAVPDRKFFRSWHLHFLVESYQTLQIDRQMDKFKLMCSLNFSDIGDTRKCEADHPSATLIWQSTPNYFILCSAPVFIVWQISIWSMNLKTVTNILQWINCSVLLWWIFL